MIRRALVVAAIAASAPHPARAHAFAPALLQLEEVSADRVDVRWKQPAVRVQGSRLRPVLPPACIGLGDPVVQQDGTGLRASWQIRCPDGLARAAAQPRRSWFASSRSQLSSRYPASENTVGSAIVWLPLAVSTRADADRA